MTWSRTGKSITIFGLVVLLGIAGHLWFKNFRAVDGTFSSPIKRGPVVESVYGLGTVTAARSFQLRLAVVSTILRLYVREGDFIRKGARLLVLDNGIGSYIAPFSGVVTALPFKEKETVFPQIPIITLTDVGDRYLLVALDQTAVLRVERGQKAYLSFDTIRDQSFEGVVESIYSSQGNFLVRLAAKDLPAKILPGMTADVAIATAEYSQVLLAPIAALDFGGVWVERKNGPPKRVEVQTGLRDGAMIEIITGDVKEGDRLLIKSKAGL